MVGRRGVSPPAYVGISYNSPAKRYLCTLVNLGEDSDDVTSTVISVISVISVIPFIPIANLRSSIA